MDEFELKLQEELKRLKKRLEKNTDFIRLQHVKALLETYRSSVSKPKIGVEEVERSIDDNFPFNSSFIEQIAYIIKRENRFLHNSEILDFIKEYWRDTSEDDAKRRISAQLSKAKREGIGGITTFKRGNSKRQVYWGAKKWLNENGKIISGHEPDGQSKKDKNISLF